MKVECPSCHKVYSLADENLVTGKEVAFPCPACQGTIRLDLRSKSGQEGIVPLQGNKREQQKTTVASTPSVKKQPSGEVLKEKIRHFFTRLAFDECIFLSDSETDRYIIVEKRDRDDIMKVRKSCGI